MVVKTLNNTKGNEVSLNITTHSPVSPLSLPVTTTQNLLCMFFQNLVEWLGFFFAYMR